MNADLVDAQPDAGGKAEAAYRPDPSGHAVLADLASSLGGKSFDQTQLSAAARYLQSRVGSGSTIAGAATAEHRYPLGPYVALLALLALLGYLGLRAVRLTRQ